MVILDISGMFVHIRIVVVSVASGTETAVTSQSMVRALDIDVCVPANAETADRKCQ